MESKIISLTTLMHTHGLGRRGVKKLIAQFGGATQVLEAGLDRQKELLFGKYRVLNWQKDLEIAQKEGVELLSYQDPRYPQQLLTIPDFPLLLYVKGRVLENSPTLALIGTRNASFYGLESAERIAKEISSAGVCVVSGLARGIDTAAHRGALLSEGRTIAVLGSGMCHLYPQENQALAHKIVESGAIISEYPMQTAVSKGLFPQRNRIVSGLSRGVCLIESPLKGGGMLTMNLAEQQNRALFALPGRVDCPSFEGNHFLIKQKRAQLIEGGMDLLYYLDIPLNQKAIQHNLPSLTPEEIAFLKRMPSEEKSIEELVLLTQLPIMQLNVILTRLVLKKIIKESPGKIFKKVMVHGKSINHC